MKLGSALRKSDYAMWEYESILSQKVLVSAGHRCMEAGGFHGHRWHRKAAECFMDVPTSHVLHAKGLFVFEPAYEDPASAPFQMSFPSSIPPSKSASGTAIRSWHIMTTSMHDPTTHPIPGTRILEMQWLLNRVTALSSAADRDPAGQGIADDNEGFMNRDLEPFSPRNQPGQQSAAFPAVRRLRFRLDRDGKASPKHLLKYSRNTAAWVQTRDTVASSPCARCARGCGPFETCVVLNRDGT